MLCMSRRTFAEVMAILLWVSASAFTQAQPVLTIEVDKPIAKLSPMLYGLMAAQIKQASVRNGGYWGMTLKPNITYKGSFYAKEDSESLGPVSIRLLTDADDTVLATTSVPGLTTQWKQYHFSLKTGSIRPSSTNHLVLTVGHPGTLWLSLVSLFPPTYPD